MDGMGYGRRATRFSGECDGDPSLRCTCPANCYKIRLCGRTSSPFRFTLGGVRTAATATTRNKPAYLARKSETRRVPMLETEDRPLPSASRGRSCSISAKAPHSSRPIAGPEEAEIAFAVDFFEQYSHEPYVAEARYIAKLKRRPKSCAKRCRRDAGADGARQRGVGVMETPFERPRQWFRGLRATSIADIATLFR
jgi:glutathione S-transferase